MSDPVTNVEIEDVLSSIRKLVADEKRMSPTPKKPTAAPGKLVLTPAQRITEVPDPIEKPTENESTHEPVLLTDPVLSDPAADQQRNERPIDEIPRTARLAEFGQVEGLFPDIEDVEAAHAAEPKPDVSQADDAPNEARLELGRLIEEEVAAALADVKEGDWDDDAAAERDEDEDWGDFADDASEMSDYAEDASDDVPLVESIDDPDEPELATAATPQPPLTLEDKVAALGRLVAREANDFEEERDAPAEVDLAIAAEPMSWPDPAPFDEMVEPEEDVGSNVLRSETAWLKPAAKDAAEKAPEPEIASEEPGIETPRGEDVSAIDLDEDMLREMVVEIVRSELQGALGERITRNVRKLVRREIHRMLISQELE
jgi:hypothetical protein